MATYTLSQDRLDEAYDYIRAAIRAAGADPDLYEPGTLLYDHTVAPIIVAVAMLREDLQRLGAHLDPRQFDSLSDDERQSALQMWSSRLLLDPVRTSFARSQVALDLTARASLQIAPSDTFTSREGRVFVAATAAPVQLLAADLQPITTGDGSVLYRTVIDVIAKEAGVAGQAEAGVMLRTSVQSVYLSRVVLLGDAIVPEATESTAQWLARASDALSHAVPVTRRSVDRYLLPSSGVAFSRAIGAGDPEMSRDVPALYGVAQGTHTFGAMDVYVWGPVTTQVFATQVGRAQTIQTSGHVVLHDMDYRARGVDMRSVVPAGALVRLRSARGDEPTVMRVREVAPSCLLLDPMPAFPRQRPVGLHGGRTYVGCEFDGTDLVTIPSQTSRLQATDVGNYLYVGGGAAGVLAKITAVSGVAALGYYTAATLDLTAAQAATLDLTDLVVSVWDGQLWWSAGTNAPDFDNMIAARNTGHFLDSLAIPGAVVIPARYVQAVTHITTDHEALGVLDALTQQRVLSDHIPAQDAPLLDLGQFSVTSLYPHLSRSSQEVLVVRVAALEAQTRGPAQVVDTSPTDLELTDPDYVFYEQDVGRYILLDRPQAAGNAAVFEVVSRVDDQTVNLTRVTAPIAAQSVAAQTQIYWRWDDASWVDSASVQVHYLATRAYDEPAANLERGADRPLCASVLVRTPSLVRLTLQVTYQLSLTATNAPSQTQMATTLQSYVQSFPVTDILHVDDLVTHLRLRYPQIGAVLRGSDETFLRYAIQAPGGDLIEFAPGGVVLLKTQLCLTAQDAERLEEATTQGLSTRTVAYRLAATDVTLLQVSP